jgi:hypothetical protein
MKKMKYSLRIVTITLFLLICCSRHVLAFDLDMTVDDDIRKNYDSSKLIKDTDTVDFDTLPALPEKLKNEEVKKNIKQTTESKSPKVFAPKNNVKMTKGTSFNVVNTGKISDWQTKGSTVKFKTTSIINKKGYTLPVSTMFSGEIVEIHQPQISCNGGLVVIKIKSMAYKGQTIPINAYVTRADDKIIFLNNIKGERTYMKTMWKKGNWGRALFSRMLTLTVNLGSEGSTFLLSPFPFLYGTLCFGANTLISPVTAFFEKGKHVSIASGSKFRIKLLDDTYIE